MNANMTSQKEDFSLPNSTNKGKPAKPERVEIHIALIRYDFVKKIVRQTNSKRILDLGCGEGKLLKELSCLNNITKLVGVDVNPTRINSAKHMFDPEFDVRVNRHIRRKADLAVEV